MSSGLMAAAVLFAALGAVCRAFCMDRLRPFVPAAFPWTTFIVNIAACLLMGLVIGHNLAPSVQTVLTAGFLGGFSTMSTLNHDAMMLLDNGKYGLCAAYVLGSYAACLLACGLGLLVP